MMQQELEPIDPRVDIVFKRIFGSEGHTGITKSFLNAMFKVAGLPAVRDLVIKNPFRYSEFRGEKDIELDILYVDENGRDVQLEMQMAYHTGLEQRMLHNWAQLYLRQIDKGRSYRDHRPVVCLWVLEQPLWNDGEWIHVVRLICDRTARILHEDLCIIAIELEAWRRLMFATSGDTIISRGEDHAWLFFLALGHELAPERLTALLPNPVFSEALGLMCDFNTSKARRHYYDMRRNYTHIIASYRETGYEEGLKLGREAGRLEGLEKGREEGREEGILEGLERARRETALRLSEEGLSRDIIMRSLGLAAEQLDDVLSGGDAALKT